MLDRVSRLRRALVAIGVVVFSGCSGGGGTSTLPQPAASSSTMPAAMPAPPKPPTPAPKPTPTVTPKPTPSPTPTPAGLSAASAAYLNLDLAALANYAHPTLPAYYNAQVSARDNTPATNPVSDRGATLGRVLFNDKRLSINGAVSCASCHQQAIGFTDSAQFSTGFLANTFTTKHAMRLGNLRYYQPGTMFWDKRAASVEAQASVPIQNSVEMGFDTAHGGIAALASSMSALPYYPQLFAFTFGDTTITESRIQLALAQYERSMITTGSRWDAGYATVYNPVAPNANLDVDLPNFTATENRGRHLFMAAPGAGGVGCASCHQPPTFALDARSLSNGLDAGETIIFKAPSLKNDGHGRYMHDGRFASLAAVVEHYNSGIAAGPALDPRLQRGGVPVRLNLSSADKAAIVAFLSTLDDPGFFADTRFSNPFKK